MTIMANRPAQVDDLPRQDTDLSHSVLGKVQLILETFSLDETDLSLSELVRRTGIPKATVHRLCHDLVAWGALDRAGTGYRLGLRLFEIGQRVALQRMLRDYARPHMDELLRVTQVQAVHLAVRSGLDVLYIEKLVGHGHVAPSRIAGRMPMYCTATGKAILAFSGDDVLADVLRAGLRRHTSYTTMSAAKLRQELARIRGDGYAIELEEVRLGYLSVASPLFASGDLVVGAVSATTPTFRANCDRLITAVRTTGRRICRDLRDLSG